MGFDDVDASKKLSSADLGLLQGTVEVVGVAFEKKRLLDSQAEQNRRLQALLAEIESMVREGARVADASRL
jgi:hypothetical protein